MQPTGNGNTLLENRRNMKNVRRLYKKITRDRWEIGFVDGGLTAVMGQKPLRINWLKHGYKDRWFADPFILDLTQSEILLLVEEYRYEDPKGRIALLVVDKQTYELESMNIVLETDTHLSFPAIWREEGRTFVYPENWLSGELTLYEYKGRYNMMQPRRVLCKEPMADAVMTGLFGKMQLFSVQQNDKLRIYNLNPLTDCFELSYEKPFDVATARNAGDFFEYGGKIYRPAQVCMERYGEAVEIQEVIWDDHENFCFVPFKTLYSSHPSLKTGLHTLNCYDGTVVVDVHGWNNALTVKSINALKKVLLCK